MPPHRSGSPARPKRWGLWLPAEAAVNPKFVRDYVFPGAICGTWTHVDGIKAAR